MKTKKIIYSILKEISEDNNKIKSSDFGLSMEEFGATIEMMLDEGFIKDAKVIRGGKGSQVQAIFNINTKLTLAGVNYLEENNMLAKTYRGLKEIKDWIK